MVRESLIRSLSMLSVVLTVSVSEAAPKPGSTDPAETGSNMVGPVLTPGPVIAPEDPWAEAITTFASVNSDVTGVGGVVFTGSSSIRMWTDLEKRYQTFSAVNRGFGGSKLDDLAKHVDKIVLPSRPRLVVIYSGDNDLASGLSAAQVVQDFVNVCDKIHRRLPKTEIAFVSIKPSPARSHLLPRVREANTLIRAYAATKRYIRYVDVFTPMLDARGKPRAELFLGDSLHLNERGYALWDSVISPFLPMRDSSVKLLETAASDPCRPIKRPAARPRATGAPATPMADVVKRPRRPRVPPGPDCR